MGKKPGAALPAAGSSAPGVTSSSASAQGGPTAAQGAPGVADARKFLALYAKGVRPAEALQQLEALHQRSPSYMTCLALAKVRTRQAVDVALKQEGDDDAQEAAVVPLLNDALRFAAEGVAVHRSPNCLSLCISLMTFLGGRRGVTERLEVLEKLHESVPGRKEALAFGWVDPAAEAVPGDKWPLESGEGVTAATHLQRRLGPFLEKLQSCIDTDNMQYVIASSSTHVIMLSKAGQEHANMPVHIRLFRSAGLPEKLGEALHRKWMERQGGGEQERRRRQQEEQAGEAERQRAVKRLEIASRKRAGTLPDLQKRVDKVRDFLLRRMAAASGGQAGGSDDEEQRKRQLEELLQQTEVTPQQLQDLLSRAQLPAAQWKAVQRSMGLAEQRQGVCYELPQQGGEALVAAATTSERAQLSIASLDGERFAAALHKLVWHNPKFAEGQAAAVHRTAKQLKQLDKLALSSQFDEELGCACEWLVPDPQSVEVWPECPGDMPVLLPHGADAAAGADDDLCVSELAEGAAASSASLARMFQRKQAPSSPPSSPDDSPRAIASAVSDLDNVDDELPPLGTPASLPADRQPSRPSPDPTESPGDSEDPLLLLHRHHEEHRKMHFMLGVLTGQEDSEELRCQVLVEVLNDPAAMQEQADMHLRHSLLGLELLHLLERRSAAGAAAERDVHGEDGGAPPTPELLALYARWDALDHCWATQPAAKLAEQLAQPGELGQLKQLLEALQGGLQGSSEPLAAVALVACLLQLQLRQGAAAARKAAADPSGSPREASLAAYLQEVRQRLTRGILAGLQELSSSRRLPLSLFKTICEFMNLSLIEAGGGRLDEHEVLGGGVLSYLGRLPLRRLLQLHAFLALRMVDAVVSPKELDRELQEVALAACQSATRTRQGCIRLSEGGLEAVAHDVALLEGLRTNKTGSADEVVAPDMRDPAVAAEQLASYCCGLLHAAAEVAVMARGEEPSTVEQMLQKVEGYSAKQCVALLQRTVYTRRVLAAMHAGILNEPVEAGEKLLEAMADMLGLLKQMSGVSGGVLTDTHVRRQLAQGLNTLLELLPLAVGRLCEALSLARPAQTALEAAITSFQLAVLGKHRQQLQAEQLSGDKGAAELLQRLQLKLEILANKNEFQSAEEVLTATMIRALQDEAGEKHELLRTAAQQLSGPLHAGNMYSQAVPLASLLNSLADRLVKAVSSLHHLKLTVMLLNDVALERGRALEGQLLCSICMQPSLSPVFTALSRHLLALKWQDEMAAEEAAEAEQQEALRQALFEQLLLEEDSSQAKDDKAKEKRRAKKAAKKERRAAADAAAKGAAAAKVGGVAPQRLDSVEQRRQEEQVEGYARMMQQLEQDAAAAGEAREEQQQAQQTQQAQQAQRPVERHPSTSEYYEAAILADEEEWGTPLSSPMPDALEAPLEGAELMAAVPAAPASPRPQQAAAAASSTSSAEPQPQRSKLADQPQQALREQEQPQEAESWETAGGKRRGKRGAAGKPDAPQQQAAAAPVAAQAATPAAAGQAGQQAASGPVGSAPAQQQQQQQQQQQAADARPPTEPAAAHKGPGVPPTASPQAAEAAPASPPAAMPQEDDGWEEAPVQRRRGGKHSAAAKPAAAAAAPAPPVRHYQRIINWAGDWICECGQRNAARIRCYTCNQVESPCREYCFQGGCSRGGSPPDGTCKFSHPPFELPTARRPPTKKGVHQHSRQPVDLIADGSREDGKPCMLPPPGVPLMAGQAAAAPVSGASVRRLAAAQQQGGAAAGRSPVTPQGLLSPSSAGRLPSNAMPPGSQVRGWGPAAAGPAAKAATGAAAATASPPQGPPSQRRAATWQAAPQSPTATGASAAPAAAAPHEDEDELAGLLDMMGIGEANGTDSAAAAAAAGGWGEPSSWAHQVGSGHELETVDQAPGSWPAPGQDAEDAELAAAIQASLADAAATASRHQAGAWQELPAAAPPRSSGAAAGGEDSEALALAGLRNEAGEYNCFLNVVVQCLWRCAEFRQQVAGWDAAFCAHDPVLAALHGLFAQLEQQEAARSSGTIGSLPPVDPAPLREALAALPGQGFSLGEMNDAAELLLCVYEKVMEAEGAGRRSGELAATFGLSVREEVHCAACGKTTHQNAYTQYFYNTQATTLQLAQLVAEGAASMGALLRDAEAQHRKSCDTDMSGCGVLNSVNHFLQAAPRVFTLQVAWETHAPAPDVVASTLAALDETVDLGEVYQGVDRGLHRYALRSMVCYYGQHYQALVLVPEAGGWLMFDDTRVSRVGSWADVRRKCEAGRIQPSVLFYEAV